jgi:protein ImuB
MLFACIFVPCFPVQAVLRCEAIAWRSQPVALLDGPESLLRVVACNERAQLAGIAIGMTKAQAEQCHGIVLRKRVFAREQSAQAALIDCASGFSPRVESTGDGAVTIDATGTERLLGSSLALAQMLTERAASVGLEVSVAVAANPDAALIAAKGFEKATVVPAGEEARYLAKLPIDVLSPEPECAEILGGWGIRTCRDLAQLPVVPLVERLGQAGFRLQKLARGEVKRTLVPVDPPLQFEERIELEDSVDDLESLAFILNRLLKQLTARLNARSLAADQLHLVLGLEVHHDRDIRRERTHAASAIHGRTLKFPVPIVDAEVLLKLLHLDLESHKPSAPIKTITLEATPAKGRCTQAGLFAPAAPEAGKLEVTLARIRNVVGEADEQGRNRVGTPKARNSHKPDDFEVVPFAPHAITGLRVLPDGKRTVALNRFRPPIEVIVRNREGVPCHISFLEVSSAILCAAGPWKASGHWWAKHRWHREEWDVAVQCKQGVALYRIARDLKRNAWFVEGLYN